MLSARSSCWLFVLMVSAANMPAQTIISNFSVDSDGWTAYTHADPTTTIAYSATGGNGGSGAVVLQEPANGANDYFVAPAKFTGNLSTYYGGTLSFDLKLNPGWDSSAEAAMVILTGTYNGSTLSIGYLPASAQYPNASSFTTFTLSLSTAAAWAVTDSSDFVTGTVATSAQFQAVLATVSSIRILGDWTNAHDLDVLDNVTMTAIPEPSVSALVVGLAGAAAGILMLRRARAKPC